MILRPITAALTRLITGVRLLSVAPCQGPAIYFANHASHLDFAVVWAAVPASIREKLSPAAAEDYWEKSPWRRWVACQLFQAVLIPREGITRENNPLDRLAAALEAGRSVLIFPEGTRRTDGVVGEFRAGLYHLARRYPELPLVPVYLENLSRILPKGSFLPVPIIAQAHFRSPICFQVGEPKPNFLARCRASLLAQPD